jgi:hypothetical protein
MALDFQHLQSGLEIAALAKFDATDDTEVVVTRGLYWKFRTNDPRAAWARWPGAWPPPPARPAGPTRVITTCSP